MLVAGGVTLPLRWKAVYAEDASIGSRVNAGFVAGVRDGDSEEELLIDVVEEPAGSKRET